VLASEPGMVPSPTAYRAQCGDTAPRTCAFNLKPVGAGPFVVDQFKPKESLIMAKNPSYWGGPVYLDKLSFIYFGGDGDQSYDAMKAGTAQAAYLRSADVVERARKDGTKGYSAVEQTAINMIINNGITVTCKGGLPPSCAGQPDGPYTPNVPTRNLKVRQAVAAALDMKAIDARVTGGTGRPGNQLFQSDFAYYPNVPGPTYDPELAKRLVTQAKAEGWDGKIRYACSTTPQEERRGLAIEAMLNAAGMTVIRQTTEPTTYITNVVVNRDYDLACWGMSMFNDDRVYSNALLGNLYSTSTRTGYKSPEMDAAIDALKRAGTTDEKRAAYKTIAELYARDVPVLTFTAIESFYAMSSKVHGVVFNHAFEMYFDKAWIEQ